MQKWIILVAAIGALVAGCADNQIATGPAGDEFGGGEEPRLGQEAPAVARGRVVVANRGSGTISVIDTKTDQVVGTYELPAEMGEPTPGKRSRTFSP